MTCTRCKLKKKLTAPQDVTHLYRTEPFDNGMCLTPPMGWNSWNYFKENINERMLIEMARSIKESGLLDAGYNYLNLDDYWEADRRDKDGKLICDVVRFPSGMRHTVEQINELGFKVGIYSSNGTKTCQGLPASLGKEYMDAKQFVKWGIEYLKYDYCYHKISSNLGPHLLNITVAKKGEQDETVLPIENAALSGTAKIVYGSTNRNPGCTDHQKEMKNYIVGLDKNKGMATFMYEAEEDGEYVVTLNVRHRFSHVASHHNEIAVAVQIGDNAPTFIEPGRINRPCSVAPIRVVTPLQKGKNLIRVFNPIGNRADSAILNYMCMSNALLEAAADVEKETGIPQKRIVFSVCEWGVNRPWKWGSSVANLWRTTGDINWHWWSIRALYELNVRLYKYASPGHWNDPDMLEVGNGKLTLDENRSHFTLWCMMAAPLLLGNDVVNMNKEHLAILTNKDVIAIDQDALGKQAKRIRRGKKADVLVRPLEDGSIALCLFNKSRKEIDFSFDLTELADEEYVSGCTKENYAFTELWTGEEGNGTKISCKIARHGVKVYKLK